MERRALEDIQDANFLKELILIIKGGNYYYYCVKLWAFPYFFPSDAKSTDMMELGFLNEQHRSIKIRCF